MSRAFLFWHVSGLYERVYGRKIARTTIRDMTDPFHLPDTEFQQLFRLTKDMAVYLITELSTELAPGNSTGYPVYLQILCSVRFLAVGSYQRGIGQDHTISVGQTTVSKYLEKFTDAVIKCLMHRWITFPGTSSGRTSISSGFYQKYGVPDILGCIDCTHVAIFPPPENAEQFINRKGYHSINVQIVSDENCKIIHINARYPGRIHDQFIFNYSNLKDEFVKLYRLRIGDFHLVGDSGYALEPWLMTPILGAAAGSPEDNYTKKHCEIRNCVERTFGYLKGTFRCLKKDRVLHYSPERASAIIYTCCILYNILCHFGSELIESNDIDDDDNEENPSGYIPPAELLLIAQNKRNRLVQAYLAQ